MQRILCKHCGSYNVVIVSYTWERGHYRVNERKSVEEDWTLHYEETDGGQDRELYVLCLDCGHESDRIEEYPEHYNKPGGLKELFEDWPDELEGFELVDD